MSYADIAEMLGGSQVLGVPVTSEFDLIAAIRRGLPVETLDAVAKHLGTASVLQREIFSLVGSVRTLQRKRTQSKSAAAKPKRAQPKRAAPKRSPTSSLSAAESDRLARIVRIVVRTEEVLGTDEKAHRWLTAPNRALGGIRPLTLLDSDPGALAVERVLGRLEHGVFS